MNDRSLLVCVLVSCFLFPVSRIVVIASCGHDSPCYCFPCKLNQDYFYMAVLCLYVCGRVCVFPGVCVVVCGVVWRIHAAGGEERPPRAAG